MLDREALHLLWEIHMLNSDWIASTAEAILMVVVSGIAIYTALLLLTRLSGLRSFSKMSSFDFAITVAFGTVIASTLLAPDPPLLQGIAGLFVLFGIQYVIAQARWGSKRIKTLVDNRPLLVMAGPKVITEHLRTARITEEDLKSKLRLAGVTHPSQVLAVVVETTGDVSVMKTTSEVDYDLFSDVRGAERLHGVR
jgi:uncharacterized membrane protein YcaP (DUF421 family)